MTDALVGIRETAGPSAGASSRLDASGSGRKGSSGEVVASVGRAFSIVRAFDADHPRMTLSQVAERVDLSRGTARRFLQTLVALGYVEHDGKLFALTPRVLDLGFAYLAASRLPQVAAGPVRRVSDATGESCSVAVLDGRHVVYVHRVQPRRVFSSALEIGSRLPAHAAALGQVLLAALSPCELERRLRAATLERMTENTITDLSALQAKLDRIRRDGFALVDGELEDGIVSVAVPVVARSGETIAALNIGASAARTQADALVRDALPLLQDAAAEIGSTMTG